MHSDKTILYLIMKKTEKMCILTQIRLKDKAGLHLLLNQVADKV